MTDDYSSEPSKGFFDRLRALMLASGKNKHDQAINLIKACILEGVTSRPRIVGALKHVGLDPRHIVIILNEGAGDDPKRHHWRLTSDGQYAGHEES